MRTELGQSLSTITKLQYLSKRLEVPIDTFLENKELALPEEYFKIKYRIMESPVYGDSKRITEKLTLIEEVYNCYGDILPEEELLSLDLIERILDLIRTGTGSFAEDIFDDYFKQVTLKQVYTFNDLLLIDYFAMQCQDLIYRREHQMIFGLSC